MDLDLGARADQDGDAYNVIGSLYLRQEAEESREDLTKKPTLILLCNNLARRRTDCAFRWLYKVLECEEFITTGG